MFSYFSGGIKQTTPDKNIDLSHLISLIKNHPKVELINEIRALRKQGDQTYKKLKESLPYITPNCLVKKRSLEGDLFQQNFISSSSYIYIDIDDFEGDVYDYKNYFIDRYRDLVSLVCISSSCGGISVLIKVSNSINTKEEFTIIWNTICTSYLYDENIDINTKDIGRPMYISFDTEVFYNYDNCISIDVPVLNNSIDNLGIKQPILPYPKQYRSNDTFLNDIPIDIVLKSIIIKTPVAVVNPIVDIKPIQYTDIRFPKVIKNTKKHNLYTGMIHGLVHLNPHLPKDYIFSYLKFINYYYAKPPMEFQKFVDLFNFQYSVITNNPDYTNKGSRTKWVHFNPGCGLSGDEKKLIAAKLNGMVKRMNTLQRMDAAKVELLSNGEKVTQKNVSELTGLSLPTIKRHWYDEPINLEEILEKYNTKKIPSM